MTISTFSVSVAQISSDNTLLTKTDKILCEPNNPINKLIDFNKNTSK